MDLIEKEVRRIANEVIDERKKLFAGNRWEKWEDSEDNLLSVDLERFIHYQVFIHDRTRSGIVERIKKHLKLH